MTAATSAPAPGPARRGLWWLSPAGALLLLVPPTLLLTAYLDDADFRLFYRTGKSVTTENLLLLAVAVLLLGAAATVMAALPVRPTGPRPATLLPPGSGVPPRLRRGCDVLFGLTLVGYAAFAVVGASRGVSVAEVVQLLVSQDNYADNLKDEFAGIAGVTTLTQVGIAFVVLATYVLLRQRDRWLVAQLVVVVLLTLVRSFVYSERLALVEIAVPAVAVVAMAARHGRRPAGRVLARAAPLLLAPMLFVLFATFEYSRSWTFFSSRTDQPFPVFAALRLAGYYATSYNNGYLQLEHGTYPGRLPRESVQALWEAPGISQLGLYDALSAPPPAATEDLLPRFANPEFTNMGGITAPMVDFGVAGGLVYLVLAGAVLGLLYRGFRHGHVLGALLYPIAVTGLLDLPRYLYWAQGRVVPAVACLLVLAALLSTRPRTRPVLRPAAPAAVPAAALGGAGR